eukprot:3538497-Pyramimonas_sp.AAC.1
MHARARRAKLERRIGGGRSRLVQDLGEEDEHAIAQFKRYRALCLGGPALMEQPLEIMGLQRRAEANAQTIERHQAAARSKEWRERSKKESTTGSFFIHRISKWRTPPLPAE